MAADPFDPYAPPAPTAAAPPPPPGPGRRRWAEGLARAAGVVAGFSLVADPTALPGIGTAAGRAPGGYVLARGIGLAVLVAAFVPWRRGRRAAAGPGDGPEAEEL